MRGTRTTLFTPKEIILHKNNIKEALNTIRERLNLKYNEKLYLICCDHNKEEKIKFKVTTFKNFIGYLEVLE